MLVLTFSAFSFIHYLAPAEETQSDYDDYSIQDESGQETTEEVSVESYSASSSTSALTHQDYGIRVTSADETLSTPTAEGARASDLIASGGLKVSVTHSDRGNRHSKMMGLPSSPRIAITPLQSADIPPTRMRPND
jgi:RalA-binding protein 1